MGSMISTRVERPTIQWYGDTRPFLTVERRQGRLVYARYFGPTGRQHLEDYLKRTPFRVVSVERGPIEWLGKPVGQVNPQSPAYVAECYWGAPRRR